MKSCVIFFVVLFNVSMYVQASVVNSSYMTSLDSLEDFFTRGVVFISENQIEQDLCAILNKYSWDSLKRIYHGRIPLFNPMVQKDFICYFACISIAQSYRQELWQEFTKQQNIDQKSAQDVLQGLSKQEDL